MSTTLNKNAIRMGHYSVVICGSETVNYDKDPGTKKADINPCKLHIIL